MEIIKPKGLDKITAGVDDGCVCSTGSADANQGTGYCVGSCDYGVDNCWANHDKAYAATPAAPEGTATR